MNLKRVPGLPGLETFEDEEGLTVFRSHHRYGDNEEWFHISMAKRDRCPTYSEMREVKKRLVPSTWHAYQVFPPEQEHYNVHPYCLHLWATPFRKLPNFLVENGGHI